jgi:hypothetical protein
LAYLKKHSQVLDVSAVENQTVETEKKSVIVKTRKKKSQTKKVQIEENLMTQTEAHDRQELVDANFETNESRNVN